MLLTRLELFLRQSNLRPVEVALAAGYTRQHFRRLRMGESDATRGGILSVIGVVRRMSRKHVTPDLLFERGDAFVKGTGQRLSVMHAEDRRALDALLAQDVTEQFADRLRDTGVASETAVLHLLRAARRRLDTSPEAAASIYDAAMQVGAALRDSPRELVQSLQAQAYRGHANALRMLSRFEEALLSLSLGRVSGSPRRDTARTKRARLTSLEPPSSPHWSCGMTRFPQRSPRSAASLRPGICARRPRQSNWKP